MKQPSAKELLNKFPQFDAAGNRIDANAPAQEVGKSTLKKPQPPFHFSKRKAKRPKQQRMS